MKREKIPSKMKVKTNSKTKIAKQTKSLQKECLPNIRNIIINVHFSSASELATFLKHQICPSVPCPFKTLWPGKWELSMIIPYSSQMSNVWSYVVSHFSLFYWLHFFFADFIYEYSIFGFLSPSPSLNSFPPHQFSFSLQILFPHLRLFVLFCETLGFNQAHVCDTKFGAWSTPQWV